MLRSLHNVISRARAFCHLMVVADEKTDKAQLDEFLGIFKEAKVSHKDASLPLPPTATGSKTTTEEPSEDRSNVSVQNLIDIELD